LTSLRLVQKKLVQKKRIAILLLEILLTKRKAIRMKAKSILGFGVGHLSFTDRATETNRTWVPRWIQGAQ